MRNFHIRQKIPENYEAGVQETVALRYVQKLCYGLLRIGTLNVRSVIGQLSNSETKEHMWGSDEDWTGPCEFICDGPVCV